MIPVMPGSIDPPKKSKAHRSAQNVAKWVINGIGAADATQSTAVTIVIYRDFLDVYPPRHDVI